MTIPSTARRAGPFSGTGALVAHPFTFKVFAESDIAVFISTSGGVESTGVLNSDYLVLLNADQDSSPGGSVTYAVGGVATALPVGYTLAIEGARAYEQQANLPQGGRFTPEAIEAALDDLEIQIQQLRALSRRTLTLSPLTPDTVSVQLPTPSPGKVLAWNGDGSGLDNAASSTVYVGVSPTDLANKANAALGPALVGDNATLVYPAGTSGRKQRDWVSPTDYPWSADRTGTNDATTAINACYQWCKTNGRKMRLLNGTYKVQTQTTTFELPRDDGSYSPSIGAGETTLAAEAAVTMPVALVFDGTVEVDVETDEGVVILGPWTYSSSAINTSQLIGILLGTSKDSYATARVNLGKVQGFFAGVIVQGALVRSKVQAIFDGCGLPLVVQSAEGLTTFDLQFIRSYAGCTVGGWWLQRNRAISANNMPSSFGGSYPASDIFRSCWAENVVFKRYEWTAQPTFDARADSIDTFFNTYFFKSANSAIYPTGRATVNADAGFLAGPGYPTYRGVFGTPVWLCSRNGRYGSSIVVREAVSSGHSRPFMYMNAGSAIRIESLYYENAGLVNPGGGTGGANIMGTGRADPYRAGAQLSLALCLEAQGGLPSWFGAVGGFNNAPGVPAFDNAAVRMNLPANINTGQIIEASGARLGTGTGPFGSSAAILTYDEKAFPSAPVIAIGATDQAGWSNDYAQYSKVGNLVFFRFSMSKAVPAFSGTGSVTVKNLPVAAVGGGCVAVAYMSNYNSAGEVHCFVSGTTLQFSKGANRSSDVTQADLNASAGVLTVEGFYRTT